MFYVSAYDRQQNKYGVTDTTDGVTDWYSKEVILDCVKSGIAEINGVVGNQVNIVSMTNQVMNVGFAGIEKQVSNLVDGWDMPTIIEVARKGSFVKAVKGKSIEEARAITKSRVYPDSIKSAVQNAQQYTNQIREIDITDQGAVMEALSKNVCLVLQHGAKGTLTSFVCSAGLHVLDSVYAPGFFDAVYLTKQLYGYTYNFSKVKPRRPENAVKKQNILNVFSCSLRFRNDGVHHDKGNMVLSSPFYSVNLGTLFCLYVLDNPGALGDTILPEFQRSQHTGIYDFDFIMFQTVMRDVRAGVNSFKTAQSVMQFINGVDVRDGKNINGVPITDVVDRYDRDYNYMRKLRGTGLSFAQR